MSPAKKYNLALLPNDAAFSESLFSCAAAVEDFAGDYLLRPRKALPHVTLCQFCATSSERALTATKAFIAQQLTIRLRGIALVPDTENAGRYWLEYTVRPTTDLVDFQEQVCWELEKAALPAINRPRPDYFPHVTLACLNTAPTSLPLGCLDLSLIGRDIVCTTSLGLTGDLGQYLATIAPPDMTRS